MPIYARISDGVVAELFTPPPGFTLGECFHTDLTWIECDGTGGVAQGWTYSGGAFAAPPAPPAPTLAQQAWAMLLAGVHVTSTGTPALDGTYACDPASQQRMMAVSLYISINGKFPAGVSSYPWLDMAGSPHSLPSIAEAEVFFTAIADFVAALDMIIATGTGTLPSQPVAIA